MRKIVLLGLCIILFSCSKQENKNHSYTFYYWKTKLALKKSEQKALEKATENKLYVRFFDIDKLNGRFQPLGITRKDSTFHSSKNIVPVVFIMNRSFYKISNEQIHFLAKKTLELIKRKTDELNLNVADEIQFDCDWTKGTKKDYFKFLKIVKEMSNKNITTTLRLHQVKDKKIMGIPPVDKVYLMCYSTSSPLENSTKNSILDVNLLKNYLVNLEDYPLKMDIALPIYSWAIITNHLGKHRLINGLNVDDLNNPNLKKISNNEAIVLQDGFYFGKYLNKDFKIKIEQISTQQRSDVLRYIEKKVDSFSIIYYQLDEKFIQTKL